MFTTSDLVLKIVFLLIVVLVVIYFLGPIPPRPKLSPVLPSVISEIQLLSAQIDDSEKHVVGLKADNQARIVWADSNMKQKTKYCVVYLHGLGGSQGDGMPIHTDFAKRYGCNLYLARLYGHGVESNEALVDLTAENYLESANRAIGIGKILGDKVIIMATSTGASLALIIASEHPEIAALIFYSPNIDFKNKGSFLLTCHWGLQLARLTQGSKNIISNDPDSVRKYWLSKYRIEALISVKNLLNHKMNPQTFKKIHQPIFVGYYYKNELEQDDRVSVSRILEMFDQIGTPSNAKRKIAFPNTGVHPIASSVMSKDIKSVRNETFKFADEILKLSPIAK